MFPNSTSAGNDCRIQDNQERRKVEHVSSFQTLVEALASVCMRFHESPSLLLRAVKRGLLHGTSSLAVRHVGSLSIRCAQTHTELIFRRPRLFHRTAVSSRLAHALLFPEIALCMYECTSTRKQWFHPGFRS
jgi:hypothetical protein